jgi:hypothetical protein
MSIEAMVWALKKAPVSEPVEALILVGLADHAHEDGTVAYAAQSTLAIYARTSVRTVQRRLAQLEGAGLIKRGDQQMVDHIPANRRPIVWDLNLHVVATEASHAEDILGCQDVAPDTGVTPDLGVTEVLGVTPEAVRGDTPDALARHGWRTNRPLTSLKPSISSDPPPEAPKATQKPAMPHPIPDDFVLTEDRAAWAKEHAPAVHAKRETDSFVDYWRGNGGKKKDWHGTWRNWMRKAQTDLERRGWKPPTPNQQSHVPTGYAMFNR